MSVLHSSFEVIGYAVIALLFYIAYIAVFIPYRKVLKLRALGLRGPPFVPLIGNLWEARASRVEDRETGAIFSIRGKWAKKYGEIHYWCAGPQVRITVNDADMVNHALLTENSAYEKPSLLKRTLGPVLGEGLVLSDGNFHARQRRLINPAFGVKYLKAMVPNMALCAEAVAQNFVSAANKPGEIVQVHELLSATALNIIVNTAFGVSSAEHAGPEMQKTTYNAVSMMLFTAVDSFLRGYTIIPGFWNIPTKTNQLMMSEREKLFTILKNIIRDRRSAPHKEQSDLLGLLLEARDEDDKTGMTDVQLRDEAITFILAGHETTAQLLSWTLYLLSFSSEWSDKLIAEVAEECPLGTEITYDHVMNLKNLHLVLQESMRLYPPVPGIVRESIKPHKLGDFEIPAGIAVTIPIFSLHRAQKYWGADADEFKPERFENGVNGATSNPRAYIPFSNGPRNCIGANFALLEAKVIFCALFQHALKFRLADSYKHRPSPMITLRPGEGMPMHVYTK